MPPKKRKSSLGRKTKNADNVSQRKASEDDGIKQERLEKNRLAVAKHRSVESDEHKEERLKKTREQQSTNRATQSNEQYLEQCDKNRLHMAEQRSVETAEHKEERLKQKRKQQSANRAAHSSEQQQDSRDKKRFKMAETRASQSIEKHLEQCDQKRLHMVEKRATETSEEAVQRREHNRIQMKRSCDIESSNEREERLVNKRVHMAEIHATENGQDKCKRLEKARTQMRDSRESYDQKRQRLQRLQKENCQPTVQSNVMLVMNDDIVLAIDNSSQMNVVNEQTSQRDDNMPVQQHQEIQQPNENIVEHDNIPSDSERIKLIRRQLTSNLRKNNFTFNMFENNPLIDAGKDFYTKLEKTQWSTCSNCKESGINMNVGVRSRKCNRCVGTRGKIFGDQNDMDPGNAPEVLTRLSPIEKSAISIICPSMSIYKGGITSTSSKGHCISIYQDVQQLATTLPRVPSNISVIVIKHPNERIVDKSFTVRRQYLLDALYWLKNNSPDYADINIDLGNAHQYPENDILQSVSEITADELNLPDDEPTATNPESNSFDTTTVNMQIPKNTVDENINALLKSNDTSADVHDVQATDEVQNNLEPIPWPTRNRQAASEFTPGFFSKAFPDLFPYGAADITKPRIHKNPSLLDYFQHLMRCNRQFVRHHSFVFVATNMWRRHQALTLGNVFTKVSADGMSISDLKQSIDNGDDRVVKKLLYFASPIIGTRQNLRYKRDLAMSFVDFVRIDSHDTKMFNFFQTFSAADLHWNDLHKVLPNSDEYLTKTVVKHAPEDDSQIDEATDFKLRTAAIRDNADIVATYLRHRHNTYIDTVLTKLGQEDYIIRYEDQGRGCLHMHDLFVIQNGPSDKTLKQAYKDQTIGLPALNQHIFQAQNEVIDFSKNVLGVSAIHPNKDPSNWPGPYGANVATPPTNCLRERFLDIDNATLMKQHYEHIINRTMLHKCRVGYCLSDKRRDDGGNMICRFGFPMNAVGFELSQSEYGLSIDSASRTKTVPNGACFVGGNLLFLRNHPTLVHHIPELLASWGANIEGRPVKSYDQIIRYLMKYMFKNEPNSAPFNSLCNSVIEKADDNMPVRKSMQQILMKTVGESDLSKQMCHHILCGNEMVEFSRKPVCVNVNRTRAIRHEASEGTSTRDNMADVYWKRETDPDYHKLCQEFDEGDTTEDPRHINLYRFSSRYTKRWRLTGEVKFPHVTPNFPTVPQKDGKYPERYESFLKTCLLMHKAGTTYDEIHGYNRDELEEKLREFCGTDTCPVVIREKFTESQIPPNNAPEEDEEAEEIREPELLIEPEAQNQVHEQDEWMNVLGEINDHQAEETIDDYTNPELQQAAVNIDWQEDRIHLDLTDTDVKNMPTWLETQKKSQTVLQQNVENWPSPDMLNDKQLIAFSIIQQYIQTVIRDGIENSPQLLLNISGSAGSGKTFFINCIRRYCAETMERRDFVATAAPSGTAAFLINGETLHGLLHLPIDTRKYKALNGDALIDLQRKFAKIGILIIDEKSMIGQGVFSMVARKATAERACNLVGNIIISRNTVFRLTCNLWTKAGLTNGSEGVIRYIIYSPGTKPPKLPVGIIATFDRYTGEPYLNDLPKSVVIVPLRREWLANGALCSRIMLPIILGYALSIHRLQGQTEERIILNVGDREFASGLLYVGASRTKTFAGLTFDPYPNYERFTQVAKSKLLKKRISEEERMKKLQETTLVKYAECIRRCFVEYGRQCPF